MARWALRSKGILAFLCLFLLLLLPLSQATAHLCKTISEHSDETPSLISDLQAAFPDVLGLRPLPYNAAVPTLAGSWTHHHPDTRLFLVALETADRWHSEMLLKRNQQSPLEVLSRHQDFLLKHMETLASYTSKNFPNLNGVVSRWTTHYARIFRKALENGTKHRHRVRSFNAELMIAAAGYRGELQSLIELPNVRDLDFRLTPQMLPRDPLETTIRAELIDPEAFRKNYPSFSKLVWKMNSLDERVEFLMRWVYIHKECDARVEIDGAQYLVEVKNWKRIMTTEILHLRKKSADGSFKKSVMDQLNILLDLKHLATKASVKGEAPFEVGIFLPHSATEEVRRTLKASGIRLFDPSGAPI
jgi:hypothetical protein